MPYLMIRLGAATIATLLLLLPASAATAAPAIEVVPTGLRATGITPGADAVWFGMTMDTFNFARRLTRHAAVVRDDDRDGVVLYELPEISRFSLLFVADTATGAYAVFRAEGVKAIEHDLRGNQWRAGIEHLDLSTDFAEVLLVRPGEGAWTMSAVEGGKNDGDRDRNGKFRLKVKDMEPVGTNTAKPQGAARRDDLIILFDTRTFATAIRQAGE